MIVLMFIPIIIILLLIVFYICYNIRKLSLFDKINNKLLSWLISFIPIIILFILFNYVNFVVIIFHLAIFIFIVRIIGYLIKKIMKKEISVNVLVLLSLIITIVYLGVGAYLDYHVFETRYEIVSNKDIGVDKFRIVQIADSHVGATFDGNGFAKYMDTINKKNADIVVITGDFVDDETTKEDMIVSCKALGKLKTKYGVYFIYGNHDKGYFNYRNFKDKELREELVKNNVVILEDDVVDINNNIYLIGRLDKTFVDRKNIDDLTKNLDKDKYMIDLNHQPNDYDNEKNKVDLVLNGHTHGGQLFPLGYIGLMMGANDMFYGIKKIDNTTFIVNTGLSDWMIDFKTGTKSEYVIIDIINKK